MAQRQKISLLYFTGHMIKNIFMEVNRSLISEHILA